MTLAEMVKLQRDFDSRHGWTPDPAQLDALVDAIADDVVGLVSELGELADLVKKIKLERRRGAKTHDLLEEKRALMARETIDILIYLMRIASHLQIDMASVYVSKLAENKRRFAKFEI